MRRAPSGLLLSASLKVASAGLLVGLLRNRPLLLAILLVAALLFNLRRKCRMGAEPRLLLLGSILTLLLGTGAELWGTHGGHWTYHGLPPGRFVPVWVPLAWALAYQQIYGLEVRLVPTGRPLLHAALACAWLPWLGEAAAIACGVWTYHWPWQMAGVPLLAVLLLVTAHLGIFLLLRRTAEVLRIHDPVYRPREAE